MFYPLTSWTYRPTPTSTELGSDDHQSESFTIADTAFIEDSGSDYDSSIGTFSIHTMDLAYMTWSSQERLTSVSGIPLG